MRRFRQPAFRVQVGLVLILLSVISTAALGLVAYSAVRREVRGEAARAVEIAAATREEAVGVLLRRQHDRLRTFAETMGRTCRLPAELSAARDEERDCVTRLVAGFLSAEHARAAALFGSGEPLLVGDDAAALVDAREPATGELAVLVRDGRRSAYVMVVQSGTLKVKVLFDIDGIAEIFTRRSGLGKHGETFLADDEGAFVTAARYAADEWDSRTVPTAPMERCIAGDEGTMFAPDYAGNRMIHGFRHAEVLGGACVMAHMLEEEALAPLTRMRFAVVIATAVVATLSVLLGSLLARRITRPLEQLRDAAHALREGRFDAELPRKACAEIRDLAGAFDAMSRRIERTENELRAASREREDALAVVSHDLRNPLGTIRLGAKLVERSAGDPEKARAASVKIDRAALRMEQLVRDLLDAARMSAGRLPLNVHHHDARALVAEAIEAQSAQAADRSVEVVAESAPSLPPVFCDRERVLQVLGNLLANAIRFSPVGGRVRVSATAEDAMIRFSVADAGPGIRPDVVPHIFDRFWRPRDDAGPGTGLGLCIAKGIVDAHGGTISFETEVGRGTTFWFTLPTGAHAQDAREERPEAPPDGALLH